LREKVAARPTVEGIGDGVVAFRKKRMDRGDPHPALRATFSREGRRFTILA
jgi:hypothetical protein